jgi:hypothetical protein
LALYGFVSPGDLSTDITVPTVADRLTEPDEHLRVETWLPGVEEPQPGPELTGTVVGG